MDDCIFCRIARGEIPSHKIYEDNTVLAFLDIGAVSKGHTLIIPKVHSENMLDLPEATMHHITDVAKKLAAHYPKALGCTGFNLVHAAGKDAQQSVFHFHMHLVPRYPADGMDLWFHGHKKADYDLASLAEKLRI